MKKSNVLIIEINELRETLKKFYSDILKDTANEVIQDGHCIVPSLIMVTGVDNLSIEDLVTAAEDWAEMQMDLDENHDCDGMIMTNGSDNYLLTPKLTIAITQKQKHKLPMKKCKKSGKITLDNS